jgi:hypothetical protein
MYRFAASNKVFWPVTLPSRGEDGVPVEATAYIGYLYLSRDELRARDRNAVQAMGVGVPLESRLAEVDKLDAANVELLRTRIFNWKDIADNNDVPLPFSPETLDAMLADALLFNALLKGLFEASRGAREKNLSPGPGGASAPARNGATADSGTATTATAASPPATAAAPASG